MTRLMHTTVFRTARLLLPSIACAAALSSGAQAQEQVPAGGISEVTMNGSGCPADTAFAVIAEDRQSFTVSFNEFEAALSGGSSFAIKDCVISVSFDANPNVQYAVDSLSFEGHATLDANATGRLTAQSCIQGDAVSCGDPFDVVDYSNVDRSFRNTFQIPNPAPAESECGAPRDVNITTRLLVRGNGQSANGSMTLFSTDGGSQMTVRVTPRSC